MPDEELQNIEGTVFPSDEIVVHTDYREAMKEAVEDRKMLFIYFHEPQLTAARRAFETETLADLEIQEKLKRYVFVKLPRDAQITVDGQEITLLEHAAFAEMLGRQGVAIVDLAHVRAEYYGHVVSTFPFTPGKYYRKEALSIILDLPPGTLTQRTMIYAVRIHPEAPGQHARSVPHGAGRRGQAARQLPGGDPGAGAPQLGLAISSDQRRAAQRRPGARGRGRKLAERKPRRSLRRLRRTVGGKAPDTGEPSARAIRCSVTTSSAAATASGTPRASLAGDRLQTASPAPPASCSRS